MTDLAVADRGHGPPLLLLHGFTGSSAAWSDLTTALADALRLIAPDLIGHARSPAPDDWRRYSMAYAAEDLVALLDRLDVARVNVLGYSMGGRLALYFAVHHPARVERLILESASPGLEDAAARAARAQSDDALAETLERDGIEAFVSRWEAQPLLAPAPHVSAEAIAAQRAIRLEHSALGLANSLRGMGTGRQPDLWPALADLDAPTLLLSGARDTRYTEIADRMRRLLPNAEHVTVSAAGHTVHVDQAAAFAHLVRAFLSSPRGHPSNLTCPPSHLETN